MSGILCRCVFLLIQVFVLVGIPTFAFAQEKALGEDIAVPYVLGNTIFIAFIGGVYYLAIRSSRRDESAMERGKKKKKTKKEPDYSKGPIYHSELGNNIGLTLVGWFTGLPLIFTLSKAKSILNESKNDPRLKGEGLAQFGVVLNYIGIVIAPILYLVIIIVGILILVNSLKG
ncbi:MAG: hypothetical protein LBQ54_05285 [Planctomycetaceae bacterium]|jgi:hypothetical protein|nr:hypothetical protein [Planctomycetaceae bacterium]